MPRPILDERITIRLPAALLKDCFAQVTRMRHPSLNEFILNCIENELARLATYRIDYYNDLSPFVQSLQGDNARACPAKDANV